MQLLFISEYALLWKHCYFKYSSLHWKKACQDNSTKHFIGCHKLKKSSLSCTAVLHHCLTWFLGFLSHVHFHFLHVHQDFLLVSLHLLPSVPEVLWFSSSLPDNFNTWNIFLSLACCLSLFYVMRNYLHVLSLAVKHN